MKTKKVFMLVIFFSILIFISLSAFATNSSEKQASDFQSNGDLIKGWYWLRDSALHNYAEWTFDNIPLGPEEITVQINALATDRPSGGRGFDAKFLLYYSFRGEGPIPTMLIPPQTVTLDNVSSPDDPLGYKCQGQVTIPASILPAASRISLRIRRESAQDNHVAFKEDSIVLLTDAIYPPNGDHSPNDDDFEGAVPIQPGTYTGSLGEEDEEGRRDNVDYYSIDDLEEGQLITLQLTVPGNANYGILLLNPNRSSRGSSITQRDIKILDYVADSTGTWCIKISRSSGEGEYQLAVDIQDQNDAERGQDAGDSYQGAIPISPDTFTGLLKAGDNRDYYSIEVEEGQLITLQLTVPGNANYGILLLNPNRSSRGSSITQRDIKILDYVADSTGTWCIKISRSSGEGEYQLAVDIQDQNDADSGQDASDFGQGAMAISPGTITGLLKKGDNKDYYSIDLEEGQLITLQLTVPGNANYGILLLNPNRSSRGSSITQRDIKILDYVADSTGTWYIKISRTSGEGEYQLAVNSSGRPSNHSPVISSLAADQDSIEINHNVEITCNASDQDGDTLRFGWTVNGVDVGGNNSSLNWRAPATAGTYTITCTVNDSKGGQDRESVSITVTSNGGVPGNHPPVISSVNPAYDSLEINRYVPITCNASDQDGDTLIFNWTANGVSVGENDSFLTWRAPATAGTYTITCTVSDSKGGEDNESVSITVTEAINHPPVISSLAADQDSIEINHHVRITCNASDQDGDTLRFGWTANGVDVGVNNSLLVWRAPATTGTYTITCTVSDSKGGEDSESVSITVTTPSGPISTDDIIYLNSPHQITTANFGDSGGSKALAGGGWSDYSKTNRYCRAYSMTAGCVFTGGSASYWSKVGKIFDVQQGTYASISRAATITINGNYSGRIFAAILSSSDANLKVVVTDNGTVVANSDSGIFNKSGAIVDWDNFSGSFYKSLNVTLRAGHTYCVYLHLEASSQAGILGSAGADVGEGGKYAGYGGIDISF